MTDLIRRILAVAMLVAAVNVALLLGLALLNRPADVQASPPPMMSVSMRRERPSPRTQQLETPPQEQQPEPPVPTISLDVPPPEPQVRMVDVSLDLSMPVISPVRIAMHTESAPKPPAPPVTRTAVTAPPPGDEPMDSDQVDNPARERPGNPRPTFPATARRRGMEGAVTVKLLIDENGRVRDVQVLTVTGYRGFQDAVLEVAHQWQFEPAVHQGRRVKVWGLKTIRFTMQDSR